MKQKLSLWQELEDDYQSKYPEERDDLCVSGVGFIKILQGETNCYKRDKFEKEKSNKKRIRRKKHIIWMVGDIVSVSVGKVFKKEEKDKGELKELKITMDPKGSGCIGKLKLVKIENNKDYDNLYFEIVEW